MSRINPLDHNPIIDIIYNDLTPIHLINQKYIPQALENQDQSIDPYMWSSSSCNATGKARIQIPDLTYNIEPVFPTSTLPRRLTAREQRQERFNRNRQFHK
jgi:hypothetical protein